MQASAQILEALSNRLSRGADNLDSTGADMPNVPDAGDISVLIAKVIGHLAENAGNLVIGMRATSAAVSRARQSYVETDHVSAREYEGR